MPAPGRNLRRILIVVGIGLVFLLGLGTAAWHFWLRRPVGNGPVAIAVDGRPFEKPWSRCPVLVVGLGDSVTAGFGASPGRSYFDLLIRPPADDFPDMRGLSLSAVFPDLRATNLALSGSTSLQLEKSQIHRLVRQTTQTLGLVVITTGGNDLIHNYGQSAPTEGAMYGATWEQAQPWLTRFEMRLDRILQAVTAAFPGGSEIFLANIYDPSDGTGNLRWVLLPQWPDGLKLHQAYNDIIARAASRREHVHLVDIHQAFLGHGLCCTQFWNPHFDRADPHHWYYSNIEDPNDRGYDALRRLFLAEMVKTFPLRNSFGP